VIRPKLPSATPAAPERPTRRLIATTVMFVGLIVPGAVAGFALLSYYCVGIAPLALSAWLACNLVFLWRGRSWAWMTAVALFASGFLVSGGLLVLAALDRNVEKILWSSAAAAHFGVGLAALFSLKPWIDQVYWLPARGAIARSAPFSRR
jgi:hypothetical protein